MIVFIKSNIASLTASFFDYLITICLVSFLQFDVVVASMTGTICGGILYFIVGRNWVFDSRNPKVQHQAFRYVFVWSGNLLLNTGGVYLLTKNLGLQYVVSKLFVSLLVGFFYNYKLQKKFVFKHS